MTENYPIAMRSTEFGCSNVLEDLLSEPIVSTIERENTEFDRLAGRFTETLVLFGAGNLGRLIRTKLHSLGIDPLAFTDNNPALWGRSVEGLPVLRPAEAAARFGSSAAFIVAIWGVGSKDRMEARISQLRELGCRKIVSFPALFWKYPKLFLPYHVIDQPRKVRQEAAAVNAACKLWEDDLSRREYIAQVNWRLYGDFDSMIDPVPETIYFPEDLVSLGPREVFVDCGAFNGDTIANFLHATNSAFEKIFAFEPDPSNFAELQSSIAMLSRSEKGRIIAEQKAVGASTCKVRFAALGADGSAIDAKGEIEVECVPLDQALAGSAIP
ncbi:MAG: FkbM family methyltransferase, partial [Bryobacteraceae bacterium]